MKTEVKLQTGFYWVRLRYMVGANETRDEWHVCRYDADEDEWLQAGVEVALDRSIVEIDDRPIIRS